MDKSVFDQLNQGTFKLNPVERENAKERPIQNPATQEDQSSVDTSEEKAGTIREIDLSQAEPWTAGLSIGGGTIKFKEDLLEFNEVQGTALSFNLTGVNNKTQLYFKDCGGINLAVTPKIKLIKVDKSANIRLQVSSVVASIECISSKSLMVQASGSVGSFVLDRIQKMDIYIGDGGLETRIFSSFTENVHVNTENGEGDWQESSLPVQLETFIDGETRKLQHRSIRL